MEKHELYWIAGILEGEGCFSPHKGKPRKDGSRAIKAYIQLHMRDEDIVRRVCECTGVGKVYGPYHFTRNYAGATKAYDKSKHSGQYRWCVTGDEALELLKELYPLMGERRREKIDEVYDLITR